MKYCWKMFYLVFVLLVASCSKEETLNPLERLPPISMEGLNTFGCLVNGEAFIPNSILGDPNPQIPLNFSYHEASGALKMLATMRGVNFKKRIHIYSIFRETGKYNILPDRLLNANYSADAPAGCYDKSIINNYQRLNIIHLDTELNIITGEFSFETVNKNCPQDTFYITNGRFDIKYRD